MGQVCHIPTLKVSRTRAQGGGRRFHVKYSEVKPTFGPKRTLRSQVWEEVTSVFEGIAQQIWLFSGRFLPQERADVKLGRAKLENRWRYNEASRVLDLANKGLEMDDLDCLSESEIKPLEIPNRA